MPDSATQTTNLIKLRSFQYLPEDVTSKTID